MSEFIIISTLVVAGFVRGYTGFGFSALVILVLSSMYPVAQMVPAVLLLDLLVCLPLVVSAWNKTDVCTACPSTSSGGQTSVQHLSIMCMTLVHNAHGTYA